MAFPDSLELYHEYKLIRGLKKLYPEIEKIVRDFYKKSASKLKLFKKVEPGRIWNRNKYIENDINIYLTELHDQIVASIEGSSVEAWALANTKNNSLVRNYTKGILISENVKQGLFKGNEGALDQFLKRKRGGLSISDRVWKYTKEAKKGIEFYLESGIGTGRSAQRIARDLEQYLQQPKKFRRIRDKDGNLVSSKRMREYIQKDGIYMDPTKNALRLARTEINMAYKSSDFERRKQIPFMIGYTVHLSAAHPKYDICDPMAGDYPKTFKFVGWHPNCFCYTTSRLVSKSEFKEYLKTGKLTTKPISTIPTEAKKYISDNKKKLLKAKTTPYWLVDNFNVNKGKETIKANYL